MRHLASIRRITDVKPIENADRLETAYVGGWPVVVGKGAYKPGDAVVFFETDSMLPVNANEIFNGLSSRCKHYTNSMGDDCVVLKTIKLRGQISQGLICAFKDVLPAVNGVEPSEAVYPVGMDVSEILHVEKYDPPEINVNSNRGASSSWPSFLIKTDEERIQNRLDMIEWMVAFPEINRLVSAFTASEKLDGTSTTFYRVKTYANYENDNSEADDFTVKYGVCSRNLEVGSNIDYEHDEKWLNASSNERNKMIRNNENTYWKNYYNYSIREKLDMLAEKFPDSFSVAIQGESVGPGVNGNRLNRTNIEFYAFNILVDGERYNPRDFNEFENMTVPNVDMKLPVSYNDNPEDAMQYIIGMSDGLLHSGSLNIQAEGVVWRADENKLDEIFHDNGGSQYLRDLGFKDEWKHFKAINNKYLLKN